MKIKRMIKKYIKIECKHKWKCFMGFESICKKCGITYTEYKREFSLSEKRRSIFEPEAKLFYYKEKDIKEFIRLLKEELHKKIPNLREGWSMTIDKEIDKLVGEI